MHVSQLKVESIPPLRGTAAQLIRLAADPDVAVDILASVIERDPPLTARLIGIANSAYYAPRQPVRQVHDAIVRVLGLNLVRNIACGAALAGGLSTAACRRFDLQRYWVMALGSADLAAALARAARCANELDVDQVYQLGLLHNLGELLLVHVFPAEMDQALSRAADDAPLTGQIDAERQLLGVDHWQAGEVLARHWGLPPSISENLAGFGRDPVADDWSELRIARAAQRWVERAVRGRTDALRVEGVANSACDARMRAFLDRLDDLHRLARAMC